MNNVKWESIYDDDFIEIYTDEARLQLKIEDNSGGVILIPASSFSMFINSWGDGIGKMTKSIIASNAKNDQLFESMKQELDDETIDEIASVIGQVEPAEWLADNQQYGRAIRQLVTFGIFHFTDRAGLIDR